MKRPGSINSDYNRKPAARPRLDRTPKAVRIVDIDGKKIVNGVKLKPSDEDDGSISSSASSISSNRSSFSERQIGVVDKHISALINFNKIPEGTTVFTDHEGSYGIPSRAEKQDLYDWLADIKNKFHDGKLHPQIKEKLETRVGIYGFEDSTEIKPLNKNAELWNFDKDSPEKKYA